MSVGTVNKTLTNELHNPFNYKQQQSIVEFFPRTFSLACKENYVTKSLCCRVIQVTTHSFIIMLIKFYCKKIKVHSIYISKMFISLSTYAKLKFNKKKLFLLHIYIVFIFQNTY